MYTETLETNNLAETIESLRAEIAGLNQRLAAIERSSDGPTKPAAVAESPKAPSIPEDIVMAISAAIAAYLGVKPHIRQIRLLASPQWMNQGRVTIQASHILARHQA